MHRSDAHELWNVVCKNHVFHRPIVDGLKTVVKGMLKANLIMSQRLVKYSPHNVTTLKNSMCSVVVTTLVFQAERKGFKPWSNLSLFKVLKYLRRKGDIS